MGRFRIYLGAMMTLGAVLLILGGVLPFQPVPVAISALAVCVLTHIGLGLHDSATFDRQLFSRVGGAVALFIALRLTREAVAEAE